ncbi:MAG TPA: cytochrome c [Kofleriaceae bacterium]|nr:cytochrome c [Kofleriaceae bacterium]
MRASLVSSILIALGTFLVVLAAAGCGGSSAEPAEPAPPTEAAVPAEPAPEQGAAGETGGAPATADEQTTRGGELYGTHCATCHGDQGQGGDKAPPLVGSDVLPLEPRKGSKRAAKFQTALDVFTWVKANMPPKKGGSLPDDEYVAILAFALKANGVALEQPLDAEQAAKINLH